MKYRILQGDPTAEERNEIVRVATANVNDAKRKMRTDPTFWNRVAEPDADVVLYVLRELAGTAVGDEGMPLMPDEIAEKYRAVLEDRSTPRERGSVVKGLESWVTVLGAQAKKRKGREREARERAHKGVDQILREATRSID